MSQKKLCFVISPIGESNSETRRKADDVLNYLITPILSTAGYEVVRADKIDESGTITTQIIQKLVSADIVIADLSERNPNVFYELSVRHASRKPFIQLINSGEQIPFDVAANRTIQYDLKNVAIFEDAKKQLSSQVGTIENSSDEIENPISMAIDLGLLKSSSSPIDRTMGELLATLNDVGTRVARIDHLIGNREISQRDDILKNENRRLIMENVDLKIEIGRLRAIKNRIDYESISKSEEIEEIADSLMEIIGHIRDYCLPNLDRSDHERLKPEIESVISSLNRLSIAAAIPF